MQHDTEWVATETNGGMILCDECSRVAGFCMTIGCGCDRAASIGADLCFRGADLDTWLSGMGDDSDEVRCDDCGAAYKRNATNGQTYWHHAAPMVAAR